MPLTFYGPLDPAEIFGGVQGCFTANLVRAYTINCCRTSVWMCASSVSSLKYIKLRCRITRVALDNSSVIVSYS